MNALHWNKPERVTLTPGMIVSYRDVGLWYYERGTLVSANGTTIRVKWSETCTADEWTENIYIWTEQETDKRDTLQWDYPQ